MSEQATAVWQWLYEPLQRLKQRCREEPGLAWEERLPEFLDSLGVSSVDDHPVLRRLVDDVERIADETERTEFLANDVLDTHLYELVEQVAAEYPDQSADAAYGEPAAEVEYAEQQGAAAPTLEQVVDQAVREVALPVLSEVAAARPELLADVPIAELAETVGRLLAARLAAA
ncbi:MAG: hypothetical protein WBA97_29160 [Actinophytocola sp.]|uniref:hypothetical protein n=1 Tax=Actinophytocola sp. TaxID=1872138 RepID=UPI003C735249